MAKNDNIAGVLSPTAADHPGPQLPGFRHNNGAASPRYQSLAREKPPPSKLGVARESSQDDFPPLPPAPSFHVPQPVAVAMSSPPPDPGKADYPPPHRTSPGLSHSPLTGVHAKLVTSGQPPSISSIASLISPNPEHHASFHTLEAQPSRKDLAPWAQTDEISRPKSADMALSSSLAAPAPGSPGVLHSKPPAIPGAAKITRYTSTPPPPGINISGSATQPTPAAAAAAAAATGTGPGLANLLDIDPQYLFYDMPGSWASMVNTPTNAMFSPIATTFPTTAAGTSAAKINAEIVNSTAMKLAALSTVNGRVVLDSDVKKFRRKPVAPLELFDDPATTMAGNTTTYSPVTGDFPRDMNKPGVPSKFRDKENYDHAIATGHDGLPGSPMYDRHQLPSVSMNAYNMPLQGLISPSVGSWASAAGAGGATGFAFPEVSGQQPLYPPSPFYRQRKNSAQSDKGKSKPYNKDTSNSTKQSTNSPKVRHASPAPSATGTSAGEVDLALLDDIGAWLKSLRLHKYTDCLKDLTWQELVVLDESQLEARGVNAMGARRKMMKVFEQVTGAVGSDLK